LLFLLLATVSMVGPTYAVASASIAKAYVIVSETFAELLGNAAMPAVTSVAPQGPAGDDDALTLDASQSIESVPGLSTDDIESLVLDQTAGLGANLSSQNARRSQSEGAGGTSGEIGGNGKIGVSGSGASGGFGPTGAGAASPGYVFGQDEAISQLAQELGMPDPASDPAASSLVLTDVTPAFSSPNSPTDTGAPPDTSARSDGAAPDNGALWPPDMPSLEGMPDNGALAPLGIATLLDPAHPAGPPRTGSVTSMDDEASVGRSASIVAQVPEPSTLMMLSLAAIALARRRNIGRPRN
jgi:hypothetical protein